MNREFKVHMLTEEGKGKAREIAKIFDTCLTQLSEVTTAPECRYTKLVRTKLEEACFFAKKAMAEIYCEQNNT